MRLSHDVLLATALLHRSAFKRLSPRIIALFTLTVTAALMPASAFGQALFFVPRDRATFEIEAAELVAGLPDATGVVLATAEPERGTLLDLGSSLQYQPSAEFYSSGMDFFQFEFATQGGSDWATAYLVAGIATQVLTHIPLEDVPVESELIELEGNATINDIDPIHGLHDLRFDIQPGIPSTATLVVDFNGDATGNGGIGGGFDGGGSAPEFVGAEMVIAAAATHSGDEIARVLLVAGADGYELVGEVMADASGYAVRTGNVPLADGQSWAFRWWGASAPGSLDGGAMLMIDDHVAELRTGLGSSGRFIHHWQFGALDSEDFVGFIRLDDLIVERITSIPRLMPHFADSFHSPAPMWPGAACGSGPVPAGQVGSLTVAVDPDAVDCFLGRPFAQPQTQLRVRFTVDLSQAYLVPYDGISLMVGRHAIAPPNQLRLNVRRTASGVLQIRASARQNDQSQVSLPWKTLAEGSPREVEVFWWAAVPGQTNGGLKLFVDDRTEGYAHHLDNSNMTVEELRLGAIGVGPGSGGLVTFETIEVWR